MIARAEAKERSGAVSEMGEDELAGRAVDERARATRVGIDELRVNESPSTEVHAVLPLALAPERDADVADAHRLRHPRAPSVLELRAERRLAASRLARDENAFDARASEIDVALGRHLGEVSRIGRSEHRSLGPQALDRKQQPLRVSRADGDVAEADEVEAASAAPATKGPALYVETMRCPAVMPAAA